MTKSTLNIHIQTIHTQSAANVTPIKLKVMCNYCDKTFVHKRNLNMHMKKNHNNSKVVLNPVSLTKNHTSNTSKIIDACKMLDNITKKSEKE